MVGFLLGCLGAALPEVIRVYKLRNDKVSFRWSYFPITVIFIAAGGLVSWALAAPENKLSAIYTGATFPAIVSGFFKSKDQPPVESVEVELIEVEDGEAQQMPTAPHMGEVLSGIRIYIASLWS